MPDPGRRLRRVTESRFLTRAVAHCLVVGMVASAVVLGISHATGTSGTDGRLGIISTARAGASEPDVLRQTTFTLVPEPLEDPEVISRAVPAIVPDDTPKPTPVPVDPNATPLPGPIYSAIGATERSGQAIAPAPAVTAGALNWPVVGGTITQYFSAGHPALDIAGPAGTTVVAAEAGVVTSAGWRNNGGGLVIAIDHGNGLVTAYNHLGSIWVSAGQAVARGQAIGGVGCTGICTGPHVHFEVVVNQVLQNPLAYL